MKKENKISVIIPIYNASIYLNNILDNLLKQKYKIFEIICVNDGSNDNSLDILNKYSAKDKRIVVINQKNQGPGIARKRALLKANGDYVWFIDADDIIHNDALQIINNSIEKDLDILIFKTVVKNEKNIGSQKYYLLENIPKPRFNKIYNLNDSPFLFFSLPRELWNKVYRLDFIKNNNISFPRTSLYDDFYFTISALLKADKIKLIPENLYVYFKGHEGSVVSTANKRLEGIFYYFKYIYSLINGENYRQDIKSNWLLREICSLNGWLFRDNNINKKLYYSKLHKLYKTIEIELYDLVPINQQQDNALTLAKKILKYKLYKKFIKKI